MKKFHHFDGSIEDYIEKRKENAFPHFGQCDVCELKKPLYRHGFYERYVFVICEKRFVRIVICRYICQNQNCRQTYSVFPDFIIPYFQFPLGSVVKSIENKLIGMPLLEGERQRGTFYLNRFSSDKHQNWVIQFFRKSGDQSAIPGEYIKKAKKLLKMIQDFGESTFLRKSTESFSYYFMASSLYQTKKHHST